MKKDQNEDPFIPLLLDKVKNTMVKKQSHLIGCNYICTLLTFHMMCGPKVNVVLFSCTFLGMWVAVHKYLQNKWLHC